MNAKTSRLRRAKRLHQPTPGGTRDCFVLSDVTASNQPAARAGFIISGQETADARAAVPPVLSPDRLPDPWLFDTDALITELDRVRELVLHIPLSNASFGPTNTVAASLWELRERIRFLAVTQLQMQRSWNERHATQTTTLDHADAGRTQNVEKHPRGLAKEALRRARKRVA